ncbi:Hypothetical protein A7982_05526 [Minicystis rosea]|nr:Hypothetical protein A7982_05526 [Minicystis rosea]
MAPSNIGDRRAHGRAILTRFAEITLPRDLAPFLVAYRKSYEGYDARAEVVDAARTKRDDALELVGDADDLFDTSVSILADKMVGAGLGTRKQPFAKVSSHSPSALAALPYAEEPKAIRGLGDKLVKLEPPSDVAKALSVCLKNASAIENALGKLAKPQAAYDKALRERDALLPELSKALRRLKKHAAAAWDEDPATYAAIFAPPDAVQAPKKRRAPVAKKPAAPAPEPT